MKAFPSRAGFVVILAAALSPLAGRPPAIPAPETIPGLQWVAHSAVSEKRESGNPWNQGTCVFGPTGLLVAMGPFEVEKIKHLELSLDSNDDYRLAYLKDGVFVGGGTIWRRPYPGGLATYWADVPEAVRRRGFDALHLLPFAGDGAYSLGHVRLLDF